MTTEQTLLWTLILAVVQILLTATLRTRETGLSYNAGPRDVPSPAPIGLITGRMMRAQRNLFETLPIFIGAALLANIEGVHTQMIHCGALLYLVGRVVYIPLYAAGIPYLRSVAWGASLVGILMIAVSLIQHGGML